MNYFGEAAAHTTASTSPAATSLESTLVLDTLPKVKAEAIFQEAIVQEGMGENEGPTQDKPVVCDMFHLPPGPPTAVSNSYFAVYARSVHDDDQQEG